MKKMSMGAQSFSHKPVLLRQILEWMSWSSQEAPVVGDFTVGGGGHMRALLEANSKPSKIIAMDQDPAALEASKKNLKTFEPITWVHANFREAAASFEPHSFDRILIDLGVSSHQLDTATRGFSFQKEGPLDMRMNTTEGMTAEEFLAHCSEDEFVTILRDYGEENRARWFARRWLEVRKTRPVASPVTTTREFVEAFGFTFESKDRTGRHPMTRVFQAIRMHINQELQVLQEVLEALPQLLKPFGRVSILTFHSLEDREVKWLLKGKLKPLHKKVLLADDDECDENPRARSAKLRVYENERG